MKIELKYFSGTGNSYKILNICHEKFLQNKCHSKISPILSEKNFSSNVDLIGFCFPVYAFGIPRICRKYLKRLPKFKESTKVFILITAGNYEEAGFSVQECEKILQKKNLQVVYTRVIEMPSNWIVAMNPPSREEAEPIIANGIETAKVISEALLSEEKHFHKFNYPPKYTKFEFYKDYYLFKWLGVGNLWRNFLTDESCNSCKLCQKVCPTQSIKIINGKPSWGKTCEQCMRCVNYCPEKAIYQKNWGSVKGKNSYYEPSFNPH